MSRPNKQPPTPIPYWRPLRDDLPALDAEIAHADSLPARRLKAESFILDALRIANATREQVDTAEQLLASLRTTPENEPALRFVAGLTDLYCDPYGPAAPIDSFGSVYHMAHLRPEEVAAATLDLNVSRLTLAAVAAVRATRIAPQMFEQGCSNITKHEQRIAELHAKRGKLLQAAADLVQLSDYQWTGIGQVAYAISGGAVPASAPGDPTGMERLAAWFKAQPRQPVAETTEVAEHA